MSMVKALRFPVTIRQKHGRLTRAASADKPELEIATPPEFHGGIKGVWTPEDLLVTSAASCYAVTLVAVAERRGIPIHDLRVHGTGHVSKRDDRRFGFVVIELTAELETDAELVEAANVAARHAESSCLIAQALDVPVHVRMNVRPLTLAAA